MNECKILLEYGASVAQCDNNGDTVFHWCARRGFGSMIHHLCEMSRKIEKKKVSNILKLQNTRKNTCFQVAANESVREFISKELASSEVKKLKKPKVKSPK